MDYLEIGHLDPITTHTECMRCWNFTKRSSQSWHALLDWQLVPTFTTCGCVPKYWLFKNAPDLCLQCSVCVWCSWGLLFSCSCMETIGMRRQMCLCCFRGFFPPPRSAPLSFREGVVKWSMDVYTVAVETVYPNLIWTVCISAIAQITWIWLIYPFRRSFPKLFVFFLSSTSLLSHLCYVLRKSHLSLTPKSFLGKETLLFRNKLWGIAGGMVVMLKKPQI